MKIIEMPTKKFNFQLLTKEHVLLSVRWVDPVSRAEELCK